MFCNFRKMATLVHKAVIEARCFSGIKEKMQLIITINSSLTPNLYNIPIPFFHRG